MPQIKFSSFGAFLICIAILSICVSCYHQKTNGTDALALHNEHQRDLLSFQHTHHYTNNYNFIVKSDSLVLLKQQPEEIISGLKGDSIVVHKNNHLVVVDIRIMKTDPTDTVWVQVARDQSTFGWIHESRLLPNVVPDDPISQFILIFSDTHLLIFLIVISLISVGYIIRKLLRQRLPIVHFRDISSFYPTLLVLIVASSATLYAGIQMFAPDVWRHFYYHPTLNPFSVPPMLGIFLSLVWAMLIVGLAATDDVRHQLPFGEAILYLCGLGGVCAVVYIVFSISTLYYIGFPLLVCYIFFAIKRYLRESRVRFLCGNCGAQLHKKGYCPHCKTFNN